MSDTPCAGDSDAAGAGASASLFSEALGTLRRTSGWRWKTLRLVWLAYSAILFIAPAQQHSLAAWVAVGLLYPCFLALYLGLAFGGSRRLKRALLAGMSLFAVAYGPFNPGASIAIPYVAAFVPFAFESISTCIALILAAAAVATVEGWLLHQASWIWTWFSCAFFALPAGLSNLVSAVQARANSRLALAKEQIEHLAQVAERERIARDMHDVLGHTLSLIVLKAELAGRLLAARPRQAQQEIAEVERTARKALGEVREAIRGYRSEGLAAELARARRTLSLAGVTLECAEPLPRVDPLAESALALVLRESVTNIVRHARAQRCRLSVSVDHEGTALRIEDDGRGGIEHEGNGLRGMRERLATLGGALAIDSEQGTRLTARIPARPAAAQAPPA